jgi:FtsZ-binding cell division protein ZapB
LIGKRKVDRMISEFQLLARKIDQLAEMATTLRGENAQLRRQLADVSADYDACQGKMREAQQRVGALLAQLPAPEPEPDDEGDEMADDASGEVAA